MTTQEKDLRTIVSDAIAEAKQESEQAGGLPFWFSGRAEIDKPHLLDGVDASLIPYLICALAETVWCQTKALDEMWQETAHQAQYTPEEASVNLTNRERAIDECVMAAKDVAVEESTPTLRILAEWYLDMRDKLKICVEARERADDKVRRIKEVLKDG